MKINVIITGATGMVGKSVLQECFIHPEVEKVLVVNRKPIGLEHEKMEEIILRDFFDLSNIKNELKEYNACFFCLGISAFRKKEEEYHKITYDLTLNFARNLVDLNPDMTFIYVSGMSTDSSEKGKIMWARVKGKTENTLLKLPFKAAYMFRPGFIQPGKGIKSSTGLYNFSYTLFKPLFPFLKILFPKSMTTSKQLGQAMINCAVSCYHKTILENQDINELAEG